MKTLRLGWLGLAVWALTAACSVWADDTSIVLNLALPWTLGSGVSPRTEQWHAEHAGTSFQVFVNEPGKGVNLNYPVPLRVDPRQTPTMALTYRATNLRTNEPQKDVFAFYDDRVSSELCVVRHRDLVVDGQVHTLRVDLAEKLAEKKAGAEALNCLDIRVHDANEGTCAFELIDLRFERAPATAVASNSTSNLAPVRVRVLDPSGSPVAGARITLDPHLRDLSVTAMTGADGRAAVCASRADQPLTRRSLLVSKEGCVQVLFCDLSDVDSKTELTVSLYSAQTVSGLVVDENGHPVAGAVGDVWLGYWPQQERRGHPLRLDQISRISANADGRWTSPPFPGTSGVDVQVRWRQAGYIEDQSGVQYSGRLLLSALRDGTARSVLKRGIALTGRVTGTNGLPIAGAEVTQGEDRNRNFPAPVTRTDSDGRYRFDRVPTGSLVLTVRAREHAPQLVRIDAVAGMPPIDFTLGPPSLFHFRVVDDQRRPLKGVPICADGWKGCRTLEERVFTDAAGEATWKGPPDPVTFEILAGGMCEYSDATFSPSKDTNDVHVVELKPPLHLTLTVTDARTGAPVAHFTVVPGIVWTSDSQHSISWQRDFGDGFCVGRDGQWAQTFSYYYPQRIFRVEADGYAPAMSPTFATDVGDVHASLRLDPAPPITGKLVDPDEQPVAGTTVFLVIGKEMPRIWNGRIQQSHGCATTTTDAAGNFTFPSQGGDRFVLQAATAAGYLAMEGTNLAASGGIATMQRWGALSGRLLVDGQPSAGQRVALSQEWSSNSLAPSYFWLQAETDAQGAFFYDNLPAGPATIGRIIPCPSGSWKLAQKRLVEIASGRTNSVQLGGTGRPVTGRYLWPTGTVSRSLDYGLNSLDSKVDTTAIDDKVKHCLPDGFDGWESARQQAFLTSEKGKAAQEQIDRVRADAYKRYEISIAADGSFRIDDVEPGNYILHLQSYAPTEAGPACGGGTPIARHTCDVHVPPLPVGVAYVAEPLNLGDLVVNAIPPALQVGQPAPDFTVRLLNPDAETQDITRVDIPTFKLADCRGKVVLVDFWSTRCRPGAAETPHLKTVWERFGAEPRFTMIGVSFDSEPEVAVRFARQNKFAWRQGFVGDLSHLGMIEAFKFNRLPSFWLIGPDGVVIAKDLPGETLCAAIADALGTKGEKPKNP